jgi:BASS family bile acid:Na+ symporter
VSCQSESHPAAALTIAAANFPNADEHGAVALYGLVTAAVGALYTRWLRRRSVTLSS